MNLSPHEKCYDENSSPAGSYRCNNDSMCNGKRKCFTWNVNLLGICTGNAVTGEMAGYSPFSFSTTGDMWNALAPYQMYASPILTNQEKEQLNCAWNKN